MFRLLVVALLLHHIEGVCKPKSQLTLLLERYAALMAGPEHQEDIERAREQAEIRFHAVVERVQAARQVQLERITALQSQRLRQALEASEPRTVWQDIDDARVAEVRRREV